MEFVSLIIFVVGIGTCLMLIYKCGYGLAWPDRCFCALKFYNIASGVAKIKNTSNESLETLSLDLQYRTLVSPHTSLHQPDENEPMSPPEVSRSPKIPHFKILGPDRDISSPIPLPFLHYTHSKISHPPIITPIPPGLRTPPAQRLVLRSPHLSRLRIPVSLKLRLRTSPDVRV